MPTERADSRAAEAEAEAEAEAGSSAAAEAEAAAAPRAPPAVEGLSAAAEADRVPRPPAPPPKAASNSVPARASASVDGLERWALLFPVPSMAPRASAKNDAPELLLLPLLPPHVKHLHTRVTRSG